MSETVSMTLTDFLLARIAEELESVDGIYQGEGDPEFFWGPDRIRAECAARRAVVIDVLDAASDRPDDRYTMGLMAACVHLASAYADHPDYRDEWRA